MSTTLADMLRASADLIEGANISNGAILVWKADQDVVPAAIWNIVDHDDIDWVAFVPDSFKDLWISWLNSDAFGASIYSKDIAGGTVFEGHH